MTSAVCKSCGWQTCVTNCVYTSFAWHPLTTTTTQINQHTSVQSQALRAVSSAQHADWWLAIYVMLTPARKPKNLILLTEQKELLQSPF